MDSTATLFVTRETREYQNVFHTMTDLMNVYITLHMLGWSDEPHQIVLLDNHRPGALDPLWPAVAASGGRSALTDPWHANGTGPPDTLVVHRVNHN